MRKVRRGGGGGAAPVPEAGPAECRTAAGEEGGAHLAEEHVVGKDEPLLKDSRRRYRRVDVSVC